MNTSQEIQLSDIFHTSWEPFPWKKRVRILRTIQYLHRLEPGHFYRGYLINRILSKLAKNKRLFRMLSGEQRVDIFLDHPLINEPLQDFAIKEIKIKGTAYLPPSALLLDFTYNRWKVAEAKFTKYLCLCHEQLTEEKETDTSLKSDIKTELSKFLACIYTPYGAKGYQEEDIATNGQKLLRKLAQWEVELILEAYGHIRNHLIDKYELKEGSEHDDLSDQTEELVPTYTGQMWMDMQYELAETDAFKGYETVGRSDLHTILYQLQRLKNKKPKHADTH